MELMSKSPVSSRVQVNSVKKQKFKRREEGVTLRKEGQTSNREGLGPNNPAHATTATV